MGMKLFVLLGVLICGGPLVAQQVLTDNDVAKMIQAGVAPDIVLKLIAESPVQFVFQADHLIALKKAGVPDDVVRAMAARSSEAPSIRYIRFSSEVQVVPAKHGGRIWTRLKIW